MTLIADWITRAAKVRYGPDRHLHGKCARYGERLCGREGVGTRTRYTSLCSSALIPKLLAFCMERGENDLSVEVRTDQVDSHHVFFDFSARSTAFSMNCQAF
jgi:hypothetical protein